MLRITQRNAWARRKFHEKRVSSSLTCDPVTRLAYLQCISDALRPWVQAHDLNVDDHQLLAAYGQHESRLESQTPGALYPDIVARTMTALGHDLSAAVTDAEAAQFAASIPHWPAFPDTQHAPASLAERYELIILSNVDRRS